MGDPLPDTLSQLHSSVSHFAMLADVEMITDRVVLTNKTNVDGDDLPTAAPGPPLKRQTEECITRQVHKRPKLHGTFVDAAFAEESSSEDESYPPYFPRVSRRRGVPYTLGSWPVFSALSTRGFMRADHSTRSILLSHVSSDKSDVFQCYSTEVNTFVAPPYACSYSHGAKTGGSALLAVATEQGLVHIFNTRQRNEWDCEPQRTTFQPYANGIFDVQWSADDTLLASASAGQSAQVSSVDLGGARVIRRLHGHTGTVKCISWDPSRAGSVLSTGGRDGCICVWDLRNSSEAGVCTPVMTISGAHDEQNNTPKPRGKKSKLTAPVRSITSLLYSDNVSYRLVSSGSVNGILRYWDLRMPNTGKKGKNSEKGKVTPANSSSLDPTTYQATRRSRGITSLSLGSGPSAGIYFALGNDSLVHTYDVTSLEPLSGRTIDPEQDKWAYSHMNMRTNSFYVRSAVSPCGRWLASGGADRGSVFLFDIGGSTSSRWSDHPWDVARRRGVELCGQRGEVGAVDWADGMLATCADDGTVRIWRPDPERYEYCRTNPEESRWSWKWSEAE